MKKSTIDKWYATRHQFGGGGMSDHDCTLLMQAHHFHFGLLGRGKLTVKLVNEYINEGKWK